MRSMKVIQTFPVLSNNLVSVDSDVDTMGEQRRAEFSWRSDHIYSFK